jgi:hypothetical protein
MARRQDLNEFIPKRTLWRAMRRLWCRHAHTVVTARAGIIPPHLVCEACGWREPMLAEAPKATRTWDSTRDETRYLSQKKRRVVLEQQKQSVISQRSAPTPAAVKARRARQDNVFDITRTHAR